MTHAAQVSRVALIASLAFGVTLPVLSAPPEKKPIKPAASVGPRLSPDALLGPTLSTLRISRPLGLPPVGSPCDADETIDDCSSKIRLQLGTVTFQVGGKPETKNLCVAIGYDVEVRVGRGRPKKVTYTLDVQDAAIQSPEFIRAHIDKDDGTDFADQNVSANKAQLVVRTRRQIQGNAIFFLPLIKWYNGSQWDLCAAVDPKIVNVP